MLSPHIYAAFAQERHQTFLAQAETDGRNRQARRQRRRDSATAAATGRPVRRADASLLADGFARLSARSRRLRFLSPKKDVSAAELGYVRADLVRREHGALQYEIMLGSEGTGE
jgi:hypothetical protein